MNLKPIQVIVGYFKHRYILQLMNESIPYTVAIHEAGHAWMFCKEGVRFIRLSIEPNSNKWGGVAPDPEQPKDKDPMAYFHILLGGAAAEIAIGSLTPPTTSEELDQIITDNPGSIDDGIDDKVIQTILDALNECVRIFRDDANQAWVNELANLLINRRTISIADQELLTLIEKHLKLCLEGACPV